MEKKCSVCSEIKPISEFNSQKVRCKVCHARAGKIWRDQNLQKNRESQIRYNKEKRVVDPETQKLYGRNYYYRNKQKVRARTLLCTSKRNEQLANKLLDYFIDHPCVDCGETDPLVLTFDHVRGEKEFNIADGFRLYSHSRIFNEIEKCDVRCFNCHMRKTAIERKFILHRVIKQRELPSKKALVNTIRQLEF